MSNRHFGGLKTLVWGLISIVMLVVVLVPNSLDTIKSWTNSSLPSFSTSAPAKVSDKNIQELIQSVKVDDGANVDYNREDYTSSTQSYSYNGKFFNRITEYAFYASKHYTNGQYISPYSNQAITLKGTDYDHIIPLHYLNSHGAASWSTTKKKQFADDPTNGVDVSSHDNRVKSDSGPAEWMPDQNKDQYAYSWLVIADKYDISISSQDMNVIKNALKDANSKTITTINQYNY
jgi:hypothetical protein